MSTITTSRPATTPTADEFEVAYNRLVLAWNEHEELRSLGASFGALVESRAALQRARVEVARARRGH